MKMQRKVFIPSQTTARFDKVLQEFLKFLQGPDPLWIECSHGFTSYCMQWKGNVQT